MDDCNTLLKLTTTPYGISYTYLLRARVYYRMGQLSLAIDDCKKVIEIGNNHGLAQEAEDFLEFLEEERR
jgi:hypothetical protein